MKNDRLIDLGLTGYEELFMSTEERLDAKKPKVETIPLGPDLTPEEMAHLSYVMSRDTAPVSDEAFADYLRVIQEEYEGRSLTRSEENLRLLAEQMKSTKQYGG